MPKEPAEAGLTVLTIGHSNHPLEELLALLGQHRVEVVADVRSSPYARYATHFNKAPFACALADQGIAYRFLGNRLGGRPSSEAFYDVEGYVLYDRLAQAPPFQEGLAELLDASASHRVALLCGEEDPTACHRRLLIGRVLRERGVDVRHVRGDGRIQTEAEVAEEEFLRKTGGQLSLFGEPEADEWKSTQSVSPERGQPPSSRRSNGPASSG